MLNNENAIGNMPYQMAPMKSDNSQSLLFQAMFKQLIDFISKEVQITKTASGIDRLGATNDKLNTLLENLNKITNTLDSNKITSDVSAEIFKIVEGLRAISEKDIRIDARDIEAIKPVINIPEIKFPAPLKSIEISNLKVLKDGLDSVKDQLRELIELESADEDTSKADKYNAQVIALLGNLKFLSDSSDSPISVRLSDGDKFYKAVDNLGKQVISGGGSSNSFTDPTGSPGKAKMDGGFVLKTTEDNYKLRISTVTISGAEYPQYIGKAAPGTATSAALWQIKKLTYVATDVTQIDWALGADTFTNVWDNRASIASYS